MTPKWNKTGTVTLTASNDDGTSKATYKVKIEKLVSELSIETKDGKNMGTHDIYGDCIYITAGQSINLKAVVNDNAKNKGVYWWVSSYEFPDAVKISSSGKLTVAKDVPAETVARVYAQAKDNSYYMANIPVVILPRVNDVHLQASFDGVVKHVSNLNKTWDYNDGAEIILSNLNYPFDASQDVTWKSSNTKIGTIVNNEDGTATLKLTGNKFGKLTVTATAQDGSKVKSSFTLNVERSVQQLYMYDTAVAAGKTLKLANSLYVDPYNATNKKVTWSMTMEDGTAVPATLASLNASTGVLTTKAAAVGTTVKVTATAKDGYGAAVTINVRICKPTTSVEIMDVQGKHSGTAFEVINRKTVKTDKDIFFFVVDCKPSGDSAGMFSVKLSDTKNYAVEFRPDENGQQWLCVVQVPDADGNVKYGKVKLTATAEDGTKVNDYIYVNFVQPVPET